VNLLLRGGSIPSGAGLRIFTETSGCRKMTNGVSGTNAENISFDPYQSYLNESKKRFTFRN
jgi:hypothetical protein